MAVYRIFNTGATWQKIILFYLPDGFSISGGLIVSPYNPTLLTLA
jgi:hypothetical protein